MTAEYEPEICDDSLAGGANPHEQVENKIRECSDTKLSGEYFNNSRGVPEGRHPLLQPAVVYVIELHKPIKYEKLVSLAENKLERQPYPHEKAAWFKKRIFYVGSGTSPYDRLEKHVDRKQSSEFLDLFPPYQLQELEFCLDKDEAKRREGKRAEELDEDDDQFAYSDQYDPEY